MPTDISPYTISSLVRLTRSPEAKRQPLRSASRSGGGGSILPTLRRPARPKGNRAQTALLRLTEGYSAVMLKNIRLSFDA